MLLCNCSLFTLLTNRNLSSGKLANRQALRNCEGLIDSLVTHMQSCVDNGHQDDKVLFSANRDLVSILNNAKWVFYWYTAKRIRQSKIRGWNLTDRKLGFQQEGELLDDLFNHYTDDNILLVD